MKAFPSNCCSPEKAPNASRAINAAFAATSIQSPAGGRRSPVARRAAMSTSMAHACPSPPQRPATINNALAVEQRHGHTVNVKPFSVGLQATAMRALAREATGIVVWLAAALMAGGVALGLSPAADGATAQSGKHEIQGTVLGPSGEPLEGVVVQAVGELGEDNWGLWTASPTSAEGSFETAVPDGASRLRLSLEFAASGACFLGYFGSDGRRAPYGEVTQVVVAGEDVEDRDSGWRARTAGGALEWNDAGASEYDDNGRAEAADRRRHAATLQSRRAR